MMKAIIDQSPGAPMTDMLRGLTPDRYPALHAALHSDSAGPIATELSLLLGQRSRAQRRQVEIMGRLDLNDWHITVRLLDVSESGVLLRLLRRKPFDLTQANRLRLRCHVVNDDLAQGLALDVHIALVRVGQVDNEAMELGFRFLDVTPDQHHVIQELQRSYVFC